MAFAGSEDIIGVIERLVTKVWNNVFPGSIEDRPFLRMSYNDAMLKVFPTNNYSDNSSEAINLTCDMEWRYYKAVFSS
jgi:hypothetical protein